MTDRDRLIELKRQAINYAQEKADERGGLVCIDDEVDYLLANGVIVPPCKVGQKVYLPNKTDWGDVENYTITEFVLDNDGLCFVVDDEDRETHPIEEIGADVFLTKEEAEEKLREYEDNAD